MKTFTCDACGNLVFFENTSCLRCSHDLGFVPDLLDISAIELHEESYVALADSRNPQGRFRKCRNTTNYLLCNWLVPLDDPGELCVSCRLNDVIPNLSVNGNRERWFKLEMAKRRTLYTMARLRLDPEPPANSGQAPLRFRFLGDSPSGPVITGHFEGMITVNIVEADDAEREKRRVDLHEPYRTLLGHFRHEIAHYFWDRLVSNSPKIEEFRALFGDERSDYATDLAGYYHAGPKADWGQRFITAYASSHPWEDWAETWAHYMHIVDTLETAASFGISLRPKHPSAQFMTANPRKVASPETPFEAMLANWFPLTYALNELNRGMGLPDAYPFVLSAPATEKLRFVHELLH